VRDSDPTPNDLQKALFGYEQSNLEETLIKWTRERWTWASRGMIYARKEAADTVAGVGGIRSDEGKLVLEVATRAAIAERELLARAIAHILPQWLEENYDLVPKRRSGETDPS
jgi:hypothetical protein